MGESKICISVSGDTAEEFLSELERAVAAAEMVELRFDSLPRDGLKKLMPRIERIKRRFLGFFVATFRPAGNHQGGFRSIPYEERIDFWNDAVPGSIADWADIEIDIATDERIRRVPGNFARTIFSHHVFDRAPKEEEVHSIYAKLLAAAARRDTASSRTVIKIAARAEDITDSIWVWKLLKRAANDGRELIPIAMGDCGLWTRILGPAFGSAMTYAALDSAARTAPGQLSVDELRNLYRIDSLDAETAVYGIVGNPVSQSLSPAMQNAAFRALDLNAVYLPFCVKDLSAFVKRMVDPASREIGWKLNGFSVTLPHKQGILDEMDFLDKAAEKIGAVNTVKLEGDELLGFNTDAAGFLDPLRTAVGDIQNAKVGVLGSGGAARAAVYALSAEGADVTLYSRNERQGRELAEEFDVAAERIADEAKDFENLDIVVNATPVGMAGALEDKTLVTPDQMKNLHLAYDLVYNPKETRFLREAKTAGIPTLNGAAMLLHQGIRQFELWTGKTAPEYVMKKALASGLK